MNTQTGDHLIELLLLFLVILLAGCATRYSYRAISDNCNCEELHRIDRTHHIEYLFRASYTMDNGITTRIEIEFTNRSDDSLFLDGSHVKVSSLNIAYQYNDRFLPLPPMTIPPHHSDLVRLIGNDTSTKEDWTKIAGERLTITLKDVRLGEKLLPTESVSFVPENPKLRER